MHGKNTRHKYIFIMQRSTIITISLIMIGLFFGACSGKKNSGPNNQKEHTSSIQQDASSTKNDQSSIGENQTEDRKGSTIPSTSSSEQSVDKDEAKGTFTFQINDKKFTATTVKPSIYEEVSDTSSVLGMIATYKKPDHSTVAISINLQLKKKGLKPGTYTLGDAKLDKTPYKSIYMKKNSEGLMYYGYSKKGTLTITDYHSSKGSAHSMDFGGKKVTNSEGKISGHFTFTGDVVLTTTMANNPPEKPFKAKGTFHNISIRESHVLAKR